MDQKNMAQGLDRITFVLGGVSSGKSALAERLARAHGGPRLYLATAQAFDDDMRAKIARHQADRGPDWTTIEAPIDVAPVVADVPTGSVLLLDCVTLWLTNLVLGEADVDAALATLSAALSQVRGDVILVSNEVGLGGIQDNALARRFARVQGATNIRLAAQADTVLGVMAGLPLVLKGSLPPALA